MSAYGLSKLLHSAAWSGLPAARQTRSGTSPGPSSLGFRCSFVAAGRVMAASACCRCWSTRRHGASRS
eukprot:69165-Chlamydomonas_euryale.AAC.1